MIIKIERVPVRPRKSREGREFGDYCRALVALKVGESFLYPMNSAHRLAITVLQHVMEKRQYTVIAEGDQQRIGRIG